MRTDDTESLGRAAEAIRRAEALLVCAGAGMGVDSGLPDFRGAEGFWRAYPPFARLNLRFEDVACPVWFRDDPTLAWGFYGHRLHLYRDTVPHAGYGLLRQWSAEKQSGYFLFTSNVDGHFERAGFDPERIVECHGSIHHLQCSVPCSNAIWEAGETSIRIDESIMRAVPPLPLCPRCGAVARPNVLMFGDWNWFSHRTDLQERRLDAWLHTIHRQQRRLTIIECGAGRTIPTVRWFSDREAVAPYSTLIRINPREFHVPDARHIALPLGAGEALARIQNLLYG